MLRGEQQQIEFIGTDVLIIKNQKLTNYLVIKLDNITSFQLERQDIRDIRISTLVMIWGGLLLSLAYGLGIPLFIYGLYKHYKLDQEFLLTINIQSEQRPHEIRLPRMKSEDMEYVLGKMAHVMSDIELPAKPLNY